MPDADSKKIDQRHLRRIKLMKALFACTFSDHIKQASCLENYKTESYFSDLKGIVDQVEQIDDQLQKVASERPIKDINKVDLAILRLIVFESNNHDTPNKVLINEGIELAKEFSNEKSSKFINGVLGKILMNT